MNRFVLILRNLRYHARGNLAVLLGAAVGAAVLTGALFVGDSLRGSLRERTERQLGSIDTVLVGARFVRAELAGELPGQVRGVLLLQGAVHAGSPEGDRRAGKVTVWGVNRRFGIDRPELEGDEPIAILSANLAKTLEVNVGDPIWVGVQKASAMPRASFLSKRGPDDSTRTFKLTVKDILSDDDPLNSLSLSISPSLPSNIFIPVGRLQQEIGQPDRVNALLGSGAPAQSLQSALRDKLTLADWGLKVESPQPLLPYFSVESKRLMLEPGVVTAIEKTAAEMGLRTAKTYTYLANTIAHGKEEIPYSIVAALDPAAKTPLGPFLPEGVTDLKPGEIILADWNESPIQIKPDDPNREITISYFKPEIESKIEEASATFTYRGLVKMTGPADDRWITPDFPGITDKTTLRTWNPPFDFDRERIKKRDEDFWNKYKTTPKAYIRLEDGQKLWGTRFGDVTSIRIAPKEGANLESTRLAFRERLRAHLDPESGGFVVQPIRQRMLDAGKGSTDFGMLFLSFSFFLIVAALMLVGLLFRLNLERRASEIGLLRASGFPLRTVRWLLLVEGLILASLGALLGIVGAFAYADALVGLLVELWPTPGVASYLKLHVTAMSVAIGFVSAVLMSGLAIWWALRSLNKVSPSNLLKGDLTPANSGKIQPPSPWPIRIAITAFTCAIVLAAAAPFMPPGEPQAGTFFGCGALLLTAGLTLLWVWMKRPHHRPVEGHGITALARLGMRNAVRNPTRSLLTAGLLASAAFLLVAVESFRRQPEKDFLERKGGSGGFPLYAESATPIDFDLMDSTGRDELERSLQLRYQRIPSEESVKERVDRDMATLEGTEIFRFRVQGGDDASCLNLYQASRPRLLGVPKNLIDRGGFSFGASLGEKDNPWKLLEANEGDTVPCIVEQNTAMWMLKKGLGDTFTVPDEENRPITLKIVALLKDSIFQSEVLIPDAAFRRHFPRTEGFGFFLIAPPAGKADEVKRVLTAGLSSYGFEMARSEKRVELYLSVQNTYLTTFQLLGGFGLLLGVLGLAVVLLRSIWERRAELALLRALGYRVRALNGIVLAENGLLLIVGLGAGIIAALAAVAPHLASGGHIPWGRLGLFLGLSFVIGLAVAFLAVVATLRAPLIPSLRKE